MAALWTAPARFSLGLAGDEARALGHGEVRTGHLILAFLAQECTAGAVLAALGVTLDAARGALCEITPPGPVPPGPDAALPQSAVLREILAGQVPDEAANLGHRTAGTIHLLLAVTAAGDDSTAVKLLGRHGLTTRAVRDAVLTGPRGSETAAMAGGAR